MKRVYHPRLTSWYDVPDDAVQDWAKQGWLEERPEEFESQDEENLEVGEGYVPPETIGLGVPDEPIESVQVEVPNGNASTEEWRGYAIAQGAPEADLEGLSRDDLRATYGTPAE